MGVALPILTLNDLCLHWLIPAQQNPASSLLSGSLLETSHPRNALVFRVGERGRGVYVRETETCYVMTINIELCFHSATQVFTVVLLCAGTALS